MANLQKIKVIASAKKIPLKKIADEIGVTPTGLSKIIRDNTTTIRTVERIAAILGVSPAVFFDETPTSVNAMGDNSIAISGSGNEISIQQKFLDMLAEKDERIKELTNKLLENK